MIFLSFFIRYAIENLLAITITFVIETLDLYFMKHSRFKNKWTDLLYAISVLLTCFILFVWLFTQAILSFKFSKITKKSNLYPLIADLKLKKLRVMTFYACFFLVWVFVSILLFASKQDNELLTVPLWTTAFILCLMLSLIDFKPFSSSIENFTHTYS